MAAAGFHFEKRARENWSTQIRGSGVGLDLELLAFSEVTHWVAQSSLIKPVGTGRWSGLPWPRNYFLNLLGIGFYPSLCVPGQLEGKRSSRVTCYGRAGQERTLRNSWPGLPLSSPLNGVVKSKDTKGSAVLGYTEKKGASISFSE